MKLLFTRYFSRVLLIAVFVFAIYSNVRLIVRNYHLKVRIQETKTEVEKLGLRNQKLALLLSYYQSSSYQDVEARRRLGVKKPDEKAYIVKGVTLPEVQGNDLETTIYRESVVEPAPTESNLSRWWKYFSGNN